MAQTPSGLIIKGPRCPDTIDYGLLSFVEPSTNVDPHWQSSGFEWEDFLCTPGVTGFTDECPPASPYEKTAQRSTRFCHAEPFVLIGSYKCPPVGRSADEAFEIARQRLLKWEGRQLERTLWTGEVANGGGFVSPSFAFGNPDCDILPIDLNPGGSINIVAALSLMETALGDTTRCGIIHAPDGLATYLRTNFLVTVEGGTYYSPMGYPIILGTGYPGSGPANVAALANELWIFGTGPIVLTNSDMMQVPNDIREGVNRVINDVEVRAERFYAAGFSCALFAVRVSI